MNFLEVIMLRSPLKIPILLEDILSSGAKTGFSGLKTIKIYRHAVLETDFSVHLHWEAEEPKAQGCLLGFRLTRALKEFGLIDHSLWVELKKCRFNPERRRIK